MNRFALLIDGGNAPNEDKLAGTQNDVIAMKEYLMSPVGGCWMDHEIYILQESTSMPRGGVLFEIQSKLEVHKNDFCIVYFSGHGYEYNPGDPRIILNDGDKVDLRDIEPIGKFGIVIADSCRGHYVEDTLIKRASVNRQDYNINIINYYRRLWDNSLVDSISRNNRPGIVRMLSCSSGEYASEAPSPNEYGKYTISMIRFCQKWSLSSSPCRYLHSLKLHIILKFIMRRSMQHPDYTPVNVFYPIAIKNLSVNNTNYQ